MKTDVRIVRDPQRRGGALTIEGTRITVTDIIRYSWLDLPEIVAQLREPPDLQIGWVVPLAAVVKSVKKGLPHLSSHQIEAALTYWHDHREEVEEELSGEDAAARELKAKYSKLP